MSPEQASGKGTDRRSDLCSLAAVLYEMATGQQPFRRSSPEAELVAVNREMPPLPHHLNPEIPNLLSRFIVRCLAKKPHQRFAHTQAALKAWDALIGHAQPQRSNFPIRTSGRLGGSNSIRWQSSSRFRRSILGGCVLLIAVAAGWAGWLIQIDTRSGTLLIDAPVDSGPIRILQNGQPILERTSDKKIRLIEGDYQVELVEPSDQIKLTPHGLTLQRGQEQVIRIWRENPEGTTEPTKDTGVEQAAAEEDRPEKNRPEKNQAEHSRSEKATPQKKRSLAQPAVPQRRDGEGQRSVSPFGRSTDQGESKPGRVADASRADMPSATRARSTTEPRAVPRSGQTWGNGIARMEGDEFVLESHEGLFQFQFGDPSWSEYDFQVECRQDTGNGNVFVCYRCVDGQNRRQLSLGSFDNQYLGADLWVNGKWSGLVGERWSLARERWHTVRIAVRNGFTDFYLDGERRLTELSDVHPRGRVGLAILVGKARFRHIRVTSPQGELLWEGMPDRSQTDAGSEVPKP